MAAHEGVAHERACIALQRTFGHECACGAKWQHMRVLANEHTCSPACWVHSSSGALSSAYNSA
eukprot:1140853-Pelagomonas_calceolata.AAC.6